MKLTDTHKARLFDAMQADGVDNWEGYQGDNYQRVIEDIEIEGKYQETKDKLDPLFGIIETHIEVDYPAGREAGTRTSITDEGIIEITNWVLKNLLN